MSGFGMNEADLLDLVDVIQLEAQALHNADGATIMAHESAWSLVDNDVFSVRHMSDEELRQAIVEDLLYVAQYERDGKAMDVTELSLMRFLPAEIHSRTKSGLHDPFVQSLLERRSDNQLRIHKDHLQDAMDFAGVWIDGAAILTDDPVMRVVK
jgi:hypothetical protein